MVGRNRLVRQPEASAVDRPGAVQLMAAERWPVERRAMENSAVEHGVAQARAANGTASQPRVGQFRAANARASETSLIVDSVSVTYKRRNYGKNAGRRRLLPSFERVEALKDVSFECRQGEVIGVLGRNGAGKSTLFSALAGQISASGSIRSASAPRLVRLGQRLPLSFTGRQHCELLVGSITDDKNSISEGVESAIAFANLGSAIDASMRTYSKGMRSRLSFAALTVGQPDILLIDEALAVGDKSFLKRAQARIKELAEASTTVLVCDHSSARIKNFTDRCLMLENGVLLADGPSEQAVEFYEARSAEVGSEG